MTFRIIACAYFVVFLSYTKAEVKAGSLAILGGYTEVWNKERSGWFAYKKRDINHWGQHEASGTGIKVEDTANAYCYTDGKDSSYWGSYCYMKIVIDTQPQSGKEHYEIVGSKFVRMKHDSSAKADEDLYLYTANQMGKPGDEGDKIEAFSGSTWSEGYDDWGYGYMYFYIKKTTKPPMTVAFSSQWHKAGEEQYTKTEQFVGSKTPNSKQNAIGYFNGWTDNWGGYSIVYLYIYTIPATLVSYTTRYEDKEILSIQEPPRIKTNVLENRGGGSTHNGLAAIEKTEEIQISSTARFSTTFDFSYELSTEVGFNIPAVASGSVSTTIHFGFSTTKELEETKTSTITKKITWPAKCEVGFRCSYQIVQKSDKQKIPVDFVFERNGLQWTETKELEATLHYLVNHADDCCLYDYASEKCGTEQIPMCDQRRKKRDYSLDNKQNSIIF